jgi:hypothetical protein
MTLSRRAAWTLLLALTSLPATAQTQKPPPPSNPPVRLYGAVPIDPTVPGASSPTGLVPDGATQPPDNKRGELVLAPLPMINPTLDNGLAVVGGYIYRLDLADKVTPPSFTLLGGFKTSNDSWGTAFIQKLNLMHDRVRVLAVGAYADVNYDFYGIGQDAGDAGRSIQLNQTGPIALVDGLIRIAPSLYVGARYQIMDMSIATPGLSREGEPVVPEGDVQLRTAALGPRVQFDSRDNLFYPRRGTQIDAFASFYGSAVGGRRTYQMYQASISRYHSPAARHVVAWRAVVCSVGGSAPFYDICTLGKSQDLCGYTLGQYRDDRMVAAQAEWRSEIWWRFGGALFAGVGEVMPDFGQLSWDGLRPSGGVGLRFTLAERNHVNLRVDYAWGHKSSALYVSVAEAF